MEKSNLGTVMGALPGPLWFPEKGWPWKAERGVGPWQRGEAFHPLHGALFSPLGEGGGQWVSLLGKGISLFFRKVNSLRPAFFFFFFLSLNSKVIQSFVADVENVHDIKKKIIIMPVTT